MMGGWKRLLPARKKLMSETNAGYDWDAVMAGQADEDSGKEMHLADDSSSSDPLAPEQVRDNDLRFIDDYYYPDMDKDAATDALQRCVVGSYLLRKSGCPDAKYTLSVRSQRHVFNVRIFLCPRRGKYYLDAPMHLRKYFVSLADLLDHYAHASKELVAICTEGGGDCTMFKLRSPLSRSAVDLPSQRSSDIDRPVTRATNGGSLKAMIKWL